MAFALKTALGVAAQPHAKVHDLADLHQLSAVLAFSTIGICLSLMSLTFAHGGEWLLVLAQGF